MITKIKVSKDGRFFLDPCKWSCQFYYDNSFVTGFGMTRNGAIRDATYKLAGIIKNSIYDQIDGKIEYRIDSA